MLNRFLDRHLGFAQRFLDRHRFWYFQVGVESPYGYLLFTLFPFAWMLSFRSFLSNTYKSFTLRVGPVDIHGCRTGAWRNE
jgi:hypothetical protein